MTTEEMIKVMQASLEGKTIQFKPNAGYNLADWEDLEPDEHKWGWTEGEYRIKPEPVECWLVFDEQWGLARVAYVGPYTENSEWEGEEKLIKGYKCMRFREVIEE